MKSIEKRNILLGDNILSNIETFNDYYKFKAKEMYETQLSDTISQYFVYGTITLETSEEEGEEKDFYISVKLDKENGTFSIIPNLYIDGMKVKE